MSAEPVTFQVGLTEEYRWRAAGLIDDAFATKLRFAIPDDSERLGVLAAGLHLEAVIGAFEGNCLVGVAGIKTEAGAVFDGITFRLLREELGLGAIRAALVLHVLDGPTPQGTIRIELIAVDGAMRGRGVGSGLLKAVDELGCAAGLSQVELDVVDTNPDAHRLYERLGFNDSHIENAADPGKLDGIPGQHHNEQTADLRRIGLLDIQGLMTPMTDEAVRCGPIADTDRARMASVIDSAFAHRLHRRAGFQDVSTARDSAPRRWLQSQTDIRMTKEPQCTTL